MAEIKNAHILFITHGGPKIGLGHLRRTIALANFLHSEGLADLTFQINDDPVVTEMFQKNNLAYSLEETDLHLPEQQPDIVVIDRKDDVSDLIRKYSAFGSKVVLIDNATDARLLADVVVYPVAHYLDNLRWDGFSGEILVGSQYFPVDERLVQAKARTRPKETTFNIVVTMGGADPNNVTSKIMNALSSWSEQFKADIIIGPACEHEREIMRSEVAKDERFTIWRHPDNLPDLLAAGDVCVTAFGITLYELAYLGVPAMVINNYAFDRADADKFEEYGTAICLGQYNNMDPGDLIQAISRLRLSHQMRNEMSAAGSLLVDGLGTRRLAEQLVKMSGGKKIWEAR